MAQASIAKTNPTKPRPDCEALDANGSPYWRKARVIDELPVKDRALALAAALQPLSNVLGLLPSSNFRFGLPVHTAFGLKPSEIKRSPHSKLLSTRCCDIPLEYVPLYE